MKIIVVIIFLNVAFAVVKRRDIPGLPSECAKIPEEMLLNNSFCKFEKIEFRKIESSEEILAEKICKNDYHPMEEMNKRCTGITSMEEDTLYNCVNLVSIDLSANRLITLEPKTFRKNVQLIEINLSYNSLIYLPPSIFEKNVNLETISLKHNNLYALTENTFAFTNVKVLFLQDNSLTTFNVKKLLCNAPHLELYGFIGNLFECEKVEHDLRILKEYRVQVQHRSDIAESGEMSKLVIEGKTYYCVPDMCSQ